MKAIARVLLVAILSIAATDLQAQLEASHWYFGQGAGLRFTGSAGSSPTVLHDGLTNTIEGTASICDPWGQLQLYTDGRTVWNRTHAAMPNGSGLAGGASSAQSALIVQQPDSLHRYFVFTAMHMADTPGLCYSVVDMTEDGGMGDVVLKDIPLHTPAGEKITAYKHANHRDVWIVSHAWGSNQFQARLLTPSGLSVPVLSNVGRVHGGIVDNAIGYMRFSPDGAWLAAAVYKASFVELFRFDRETGVVSNPIPLDQDDWCYGLEFSPDGRKLYTVNQVSTPQVVQYDLSDPDSAAIAASKYLVATPSVAQPGGLALAPNGKIYMAMWNGYCSVIVSPNAAGAGCLYADNAVPLGGGVAKLSMPNFPPYLLAENQIQQSGPCVGDTTWLSLEDGYLVDSVRWWPGDGTGPITAAGSSYGHIYGSAGTYAVDALVFGYGPPDTVEGSVDVYPMPIVSLPGDTVLCFPTAGLDYHASVSGASHVVWHDGSTDTVYHITAPGTVWAQTSNACATVRDSSEVAASSLTVDLGDDQILCPQEMVVLDPGTPSYTHLWQDGSTDPSYYTHTPGWYSVTVTNPATGCSGSDSVLLTASTLVDALPSSILWSGTPIVLDAGNPGASFLWSTGANTQSIVVNAPGLYTVSILDAGGCLLEASVWVEASTAWQDAYPANHELLEHLNLRPVPSTGPIVLSWGGSLNLEGTFRVFAADGRERYAQTLRLVPGGSLELDFSGWPAGAYWWSWSSPEGGCSKPLVLSGR